MNETKEHVDANSMDGSNFEEEKDDEWDHARNMDIWDDGQIMLNINEGYILVDCSVRNNI
jgi:hypothetical protein